MRPLRLCPSATLTPTSAGVILRSDLGTFQITGADAGSFVTRMAPLLDGTRDREAVQAALGGYSPASVAAFLDLLAARGLVEEVPEPALDERRRGQVELLRRWPGAPADAMDRLARARVLVAGAEPWGDAAAAELSAAGIGTIERIGGGPGRPLDRLTGGAIDVDRTLVVAALSPEEAVETERLARLAHRAGVRSLWSHLDGDRAVLGPLTLPGKTACRICASAGPRGAPLGARPAPGARAEIMARVLGPMVALEVLKIVSGYTRSSMGGRVLVQDLTTHETTLDTLVRWPWCRVCGHLTGR